MISRRSILGASALLAAASKTETPERRVHCTGDGLSLSPAEYSRLLAKLADEGSIKPDSYSNDGAVAELEAIFAADLGKERATSSRSLTFLKKWPTTT